MRAFLMLMFAIIPVSCGLMLSSGCTDQGMTKRFGGSMSKTLPVGQKLVNVTWKEGSSIWILTREAKPGETPTVYKFTESSSMGLVEGEIIIHEQ